MCQGNLLLAIFIWFLNGIQFNYSQSVRPRFSLDTSDVLNDFNQLPVQRSPGTDLQTLKHGAVHYWLRNYTGGSIPFRPFIHYSSTFWNSSSGRLMIKNRLSREALVYFQNASERGATPLPPYLTWLFNIKLQISQTNFSILQKYSERCADSDHTYTIKILTPLQRPGNHSNNEACS